MNNILILWVSLMMLIPMVVRAEESCVFNVLVELDATTPQTADNYNGNWYNSNFSIQLTASDTQSDEIATYYKINDGEVKSVVSNGYPYIDSEGADNKLEYWSVDEFGNKEPPHILTGIKLDKMPPIITVLAPADETAVTEDKITITGRVDDSVSWVGDVRIDVNGKIFNTTVDSEGTFTVSGVQLNGGPNNIIITSQDIAYNEAESQTTIFLGWMMHLRIPYYEAGDYSGAACCQMILNYIRDGVIDEKTKELSLEVTQDEIYSYGRAHNYFENSELGEMDPQAIDYTLGHFDPYDSDDYSGQGISFKGYNFGIGSFETDKFTEYLRDIIHWMAYPVKIDSWRGSDMVKWPNTPAVVPGYGRYNHWIIVHGAATSENPAPKPDTDPWYTPDFTVYGLWLTDPISEGIGQDLYVTGQEAQETYFSPVVSLDAHNGKYIQVAEPPQIQSSAEVRIVKQEVNNEMIKVIEIASELAKDIPENLSAYEEKLENFKKHIYDAALVVNLREDAAVNKKEPPSWEWRRELLSSVFDKHHNPIELDWKQIVGACLFADEGFREAFDASQARGFIKVRRMDKENSFYYLIPFDKYIRGEFLSSVAIIIDAETGSFKEASWLEEPARFIQISKEKAIELAIAEKQIVFGQYQNVTAELVWRPQGLSPYGEASRSVSPFYPYWRIILGDKIYFVTQQGEVMDE